MQPARNHRVVAALFDIRIIGGLAQAAAALVASLVAVPFSPGASLTVGILSVIAVIVYHAGFAGKARFCSPGERMAGCYAEFGRKAWYTLYTRSRWFLFLVLFLIVLPAGDAFSQDPALTPLFVTFIRSVVLVVLLRASFCVALGRFEWSVALFLGLLLGVIGGLAVTTTAPLLGCIQAGTSAVLIVALGIALVVYRNRYEEPAP